MKFDILIREIQATGLSERAICRAIGVSQSVVRNIRDSGGRPRWDTGQQLIALHTVLVDQKNRKPGKRKVKALP
jgi:ribosome-binding protein aMBF1 (putative translation factor)